MVQIWKKGMSQISSFLSGGFETVQQKKTGMP